MKLDRRIADELRGVVGAAGLIVEPEQLRTYECDGLTHFRVAPLAVLLPSSTEQVQGVMRVCHRHRVPVVARGSKTSCIDAHRSRAASSSGERCDPNS